MQLCNDSKECINRYHGGIGMTKRVDSQQAGTKAGIQPEHASTSGEAEPNGGRQTGGFPVVGIGASAGKDCEAFKKICALLRAQTGHDFSQYKPRTSQRRIERRMAVHMIDTVADYVKFIQQSPAEVEALFHDMLIGLTRFFRDPEAFKVLEAQVIPELFAGKRADAAIRIWVPACYTGEEAYSLAILLAEHQVALGKRFKVQIFATDIDSRAIATARTGIYPASIANDLSPERLARYFVAEPGGGAYRIQENIRGMLVFSGQNVTKDPPFSKLDLISCRNLLIYLDRTLQDKLIELFHYALNPGGYLFLGTSEAVGKHGALFAVRGSNQKIYQRKEDHLDVQRAGLRRSLRFEPAAATAHPPTGPMQPTPRELTEQALLQTVVQAGALVNARGDLRYLCGRPGMYLELAPGESGPGNILKMAREGLGRDLTIALHNAVKSGETVRCQGVRVKTNGDFTSVSLTVRPVVDAPETPLYLVVLEQAQAGVQCAAVGDRTLALDTPRSKVGDATDVDDYIAALEQELRAKDAYFQAATAKLEATNEQLLSMNEDLQSSNEELDTSMEELQSANEELSTINAELEAKVAELSRTSNDMNNMLADTGIATVFVDHQLHVQRFTPAATAIINLIQSDIGRPLSHIVTNLTGYDSLKEDTQAVLDTLVPKEASVQSTEGRWYSMRIQPYRTVDNVIEGAVLNFVDVTELVQERGLLTKEARNEP